MIKSDDLSIFQKNQNLYENFVAKLIESAPVHGTFVDCGAHVGTHTKNMLRRSDINNVIAIEAIPDLANLLRNNYINESRLTIIQTAIGNNIGKSDFNVAENSPGYSGIVKRDISDVTNWIKLSVPITKFDVLPEVTSSSSLINFIKLDLEGGELDALQGAKLTITKDRPFIVFENGLAKSASIYNYSKLDFFNFFESIDYVVYDFFGNQVNELYWDIPLFTYMFVAFPSSSLLASWYYDNRKIILDSVISDSQHINF